MHLIRHKLTHILFLALVTFGLFSAQTVLASTVTLSGTVHDLSGAGIANATVTVNDSNADNAITDSSGHYNLTIPSGTYDIRVPPPADSPFSPAIAPSQTISGDSVVNFILTQIGTVSLSGRILDSLGNPVPNQKISLESTTGTQTTTNSSGQYSLQVSPGIYRLLIEGNNNDLSLNVPQNYQISVSNYSLTQTTVLDITIPAKKVTVHVQNAAGDAIAGVSVKATGTGVVANQTLSIGGGITNATATNFYSSGPVTDSSGEATLWLISNTDGLPYIFTATPPDGSIYAVFTLNNITVSGDQTEIISLQYTQITTTIIKTTITDMYNNGSITKLGTSLYDKLTQAQAYIDAGDNTRAITTLQALISQIQAQIDIHITSNSAAILIAQIHNLMDTLSD